MTDVDVLQIGDQPAEAAEPGGGWWVRVDAAGVTANIDTPWPGFLSWDDCAAVRFQPVPRQPLGAAGTVWYLEFVPRRTGAVQRLSHHPDQVSARMLTDLGVASGADSLALPVVTHALQQVPQVLDRIRREHPGIPVYSPVDAPVVSPVVPSVPGAERPDAVERPEAPLLTIGHEAKVAALKRTRARSWLQVAIWGAVVVAYGIPTALSGASTAAVVSSVVVTVLGLGFVWMNLRWARRAGSALRKRHASRLELYADHLRLVRSSTDASSIARLDWSECAAVEAGVVASQDPTVLVPDHRLRYVRFVPREDRAVVIDGESWVDIPGQEAGAVGRAAALVWWRASGRDTDEDEILTHVTNHHPEVPIVRRDPAAREVPAPTR